jgi:hypothetical protein
MRKVLNYEEIQFTTAVDKVCKVAVRRADTSHILFYGFGSFLIAYRVLFQPELFKVKTSCSIFKYSFLTSN